VLSYVAIGILLNVSQYAHREHRMAPPPPVRKAAWHPALSRE